VLGHQMSEPFPNSHQGRGNRTKRKNKKKIVTFF
jgi:hypothetical protein